MDQIQYPTPEDFVRLNDTIPGWQISANDFLFDKLGNNTGDIFSPFEINSWVRLIGNRIKDSDYAFIMSSYYLEKGIPDEEWNRSSESGIDYFPNFNEEHNRNKFAFEYHSDTYFYKVFSALDAVAHLMTIVFPLSWDEKEKIHFPKAVSKIATLNPQLYKDLKNIMNKKEYKKINRLRNDTTHNFSDGHVDSGVVRGKTKISLTVGDYMPVKEKYELVKWMNITLIKIVNLIATKWNK